MNFIETWLINGFIALMLFILWAWDLPEQSRLRRLAYQLRWPILRLGLQHSWQLFSPDPPCDNYRLQFRLRLADGSLVAIEPDALRASSTQPPPVQYRWSKLKRTLLRTTADDPLRGSLCRYIAAEFQAAHPQPEQRPLEVQLLRWRQPIAPLAAQGTVRVAPYKCRVMHTQPLSAPPAATGADDASEAVPLHLCLE